MCTNKSWITIVDAQCQPNEPNCFLPVELRIGRKAPKDVVHVTVTCQHSSKAEVRV